MTPSTCASGHTQPVVFRVRCMLEYEIRSPATLLFNFRVRSSLAQRIRNESLVLSPEIDTELIVTEPDSNRFDRLRITDDTSLTLNYEAEVEAEFQFLESDCLRKVSPAHLDQAHLQYLLPSRYCESDRLGRFAWQKFGAIRDAYDQVLEITQWIQANVEYLPGTTTSATSAYDTVTQCEGVCRDFAHLGIALCRALTIPARYFTGYAFRLEPPDFHACFEAFIGGYWILFDATRLAAPNGLVRIGSGRDAADVSVCTAFGIARPGRQEIVCETDGDFQPVTADELNAIAISLDTRAP